MFQPEVDFICYTAMCSCSQCDSLQKAIVILWQDDFMIILICCDVQLRTLAEIKRKGS